MNKKLVFSLVMLCFVILSAGYLIYSGIFNKNKRYNPAPAKKPIYSRTPERPGTGALSQHKGSSVDISQYRYGLRVGRVLIPGFKFRNEKLFRGSSEICVDPVSYNSEGFRDREWKHDGRPKIALLGDRFIEGVEVADDQTMARVLGAVTDTDVLNLGLRGFGTASEIVAYQDYARKFKPSLTILVFYFNDVFENSGEIQDILFRNAGVKNYLPCFYKGINGIVLKTHETVSESLHYGDVMKGTLKPDRIMKDRKQLFFLSLQNKPLYPPKDRMMMTAWECTEHALKMLNDQVKADGGRLMIVMATPRHVYDYKYVGKSRRALFDIGYLWNRLSEIAVKNGMEYYDPMPEMDRYIKKNNLPRPYIFYKSTHLMNPLGHFLIANLTAKYILEKNLMSMSDSDKKLALEKINANLNLSPKAVLGEKIFDRIYVKTPGERPFPDKSNINREK